MDSRHTEEAIRRVCRMESIFDALLEERKNGGAFTPGLLQQLLNYYENGQWLADYTLDEQGFLPDGLKRGVLSQDAVFHFLAQLLEENIG